MQIENHGLSNLVTWEELRPGNVVRLISNSRAPEDDDVYFVIRIAESVNDSDETIEEIALANFTDGHLRKKVPKDWKIQDISASAKLILS